MVFCVVQQIPRPLRKGLTMVLKWYQKIKGPSERVKNGLKLSTSLHHGAVVICSAGLPCAGAVVVCSASLPCAGAVVACPLWAFLCRSRAEGPPSQSRERFGRLTSCRIQRALPPSRASTLASAAAGCPWCCSPLTRCARQGRRAQAHATVCHGQLDVIRNKSKAPTLKQPCFQECPRSTLHVPARNFATRSA